MFRKSVLFWVLIAYVIIVCVAILVSGPAKADEGSYINSLYANGVPVDGSSLMLGHAICTEVLTEGPIGVQKAIAAGISAGVPASTVGTVVGVAVNELCPSGMPAVKSYLAQQKPGGWA